jgi:DNA polymerase
MLDPNRLRAFEALNIGPAWAGRRSGAAPAPGVTDPATVTDEPNPRVTDDAHSLSVAVAPSVDTRDREASWRELATRVDACRACPLGASRQHAVLGAGNVNAPWMLIGEAPGAEEDRLGEPFVGRAGALLDAILSAVGLDRSRDVYIANVLKCRPPGNRNPEPLEVSRCEPYLSEQVGLVRPKMVVLMGRFAAQTLLKTDASIASLRGRVHQIEVGSRPIAAVVSYHPAYLLRNPADKRLAWADWCLARNTLNDALRR